MLDSVDSLDARRAGLGIRPELFAEVLSKKPALGFLEAHSENYFGQSLNRDYLQDLAHDYPISLHGVGLSLGRADNLDKTHLAQLRALADEINPHHVSEHLAWSAYSHQHVPDLLPLPLTHESLQIVSDHVTEMQDVLGRRVLVENPSNYLVFEQLQIPEPEFLNELAQRTGCGLLVDVNNIYVSAHNIGTDPHQYINALDSTAIQQFHLAGYVEVTRRYGDQEVALLIDTHNQTVYDPVWDLFAATIALHGPKPTLFEWDSELPKLDTLLAECQHAEQALKLADTKHQRVIGPIKPIEKQSSEIDGDLAIFQSQFLEDVLQKRSSFEAAKSDHRGRIGVYQNNVYAATHDYLAEVYAAAMGVVGEDYFRYMTHRFIAETPPSKGNIHLYGEAFAGLARQLDELTELPYIVDLIKFEWANHSAYFSDVSAAIDPHSLDQAALLSLPIQLNDSVSLLSSQFPIYEIHRQSLPDYDGQVSINLNQGGDRLLVAKVGHQSKSCQMTEAQYKFVEKLRKSDNLLQAIEALQGSIEAQELSDCLSLVFENTLLVEQPQH
ncbi:MAG: DUF692 family multinuclear iron-containing protein [Pseudomonadota bacterium]